MDKTLTSPLRYPGGKRWLWSQLSSIIPKHITEIVSVFFGGGTLEINLAARGVKVTGYDADPLLVNYWKEWLKDAEKINYQAETILQIYNNQQLKALLQYSDCRKHAQWYFVFNRLSYSGKADNTYVKYHRIENGTSYRHNNNREIMPGNTILPLDKYRDLPLTVDYADFSHSIRKHPDILKYLDPPYRGTEYLYAINKHGFNHYRLAQELRESRNWICSYNDDPEIRYLYRDFKMFEVEMRSSFLVDNKCPMKTELLIFSKDLTL